MSRSGTVSQARSRGGRGSAADPPAESRRSRRGRDESPGGRSAYFEEQRVNLAAAENEKRRRRSQIQRLSGQSDVENVAAGLAATTENALARSGGISLPLEHRPGSDPHTLLSEALEFRMGFQAALLLETDPFKRQELESKLSQASEIYAQRLREATDALSVSPTVPHNLALVHPPPVYTSQLVVGEDQIRALVNEIVREKVSATVHSREFLSSLRAIEWGPRAFEGGVCNEDGKVFTLLKPDNNAIELVGSSLCAWRMVRPSRAEKLGDLGGLRLTLAAVSKLAAKALAFGRNHQPFRNADDRSLSVAYEFRQAHLWSYNTSGGFPVMLQFFLGDFRFDRSLFAADGSIDFTVGLNVFSAYVGSLPSFSRQVDKPFVLSVINSWSDAFTCLCDSPVNSSSDSSPLSWKAVFDEFAWRVRADDLQYGQPGFILDALAASLESWFSTMSAPFYVGLQRYAFTAQQSVIWLLKDTLRLISMDSTRIEVWRARCLEFPRAALICCHEETGPKSFSSVQEKPVKSATQVCISHLVQEVLGLAVPNSFKFTCPGPLVCTRRHIEHADLGAEKDNLVRVASSLLSKDQPFRTEVLAKIASCAT